MNADQYFDLIIAGAGAAGLSLLWKIQKTNQLKGLNILLIDQSFEPKNDKTWCFWEELEISQDVEIYHSWNELEVRVDGNIYSQQLRGHRYQCLRSEDFTKKVLAVTKNSENITLLEADINEFHSDGEIAMVETSQGQFFSSKIFQSVLTPPDLPPPNQNISLLQHFLGWDIETDIDLFNPNKATFMDFDVPQMDGTSFVYLLPFAKNRALIEYTIFSKNVLEKELYRKQISDYLKKRYHLANNEYSIDREEFGVIPMEDRSYPAKYCDHIWNIGTVGGLAKPSTGYTFSRIQKQSSDITQALMKGNEIQIHPASSYRFRIYDYMMLYLMANEQENAIKAFKHLFERNDFDDVLMFLSEDSTFASELSIFSKMPYFPFFRAIYHLKHRLTGDF